MHAIEYVVSPIPQNPAVLHRDFVPTLEHAKTRARAGFAKAKARYGAGGYRIVDETDRPVAIWLEENAAP